MTWTWEFAPESLFSELSSQVEEGGHQDAWVLGQKRAASWHPQPRQIRTDGGGPEQPQPGHTPSHLHLLLSAVLRWGCGGWCLAPHSHALPKWLLTEKLSSRRQKEKSICASLKGHRHRSELTGPPPETWRGHSCPSRAQPHLSWVHPVGRASHTDSGTPCTLWQHSLKGPPHQLPGQGTQGRLGQALGAASSLTHKGPD